MRRYVCNDPKIRQEVEDAVAKIPEASRLAKVPSPESVVAAGGLSLGAFLVQHIPLLGMAGAPVIAGVVLVLYVLGAHAFCELDRPITSNSQERE